MRDDEARKMKRQHWKLLFNFMTFFWTLKTDDGIKKLHRYVVLETNEMIYIAPRSLILFIA